MRNYLQPGAVVSIPAPKKVASGALVVSGVLAGVAGHDAEAAEPVEVHLEGVFELGKTSAQAWAVGDPIYVIPSSGLCTTATTAGNLFLGVAVAAAANPSSTGFVRLNGSLPAAAEA